MRASRGNAREGSGHGRFGFPELAGREVILSERDPDGMAAYGKRDNPNLVFRNTEYYGSYLNAHTMWVGMGQPQQLSADQLRALGGAGMLQRVRDSLVSVMMRVFRRC